MAAAGAKPLAVTDCLNFGSPEDPDSMWQFAEAVRGLADACRDLGIPVTGGNVSLYNGTGDPGRLDSSINPTPLVGVLGVLDDVADAVPSGWREAGLSVFLLGTTEADLDGSRFAELSGHLGGHPPAVDLQAEEALAGVLVEAAREGLMGAAREVAEGGLAATVALGALRYGVGVRVSLDEVAQIAPAQAWLSESQGRALVAVSPMAEGRFVELCSERGVPVVRIGETDESEAIEVAGQFTLPIDELRETWDAPLPARFG